MTTDTLRLWILAACWANVPLATHESDLSWPEFLSAVATLEDQVQRLTESNTVWQIRARQTEERLLELTAGEVPTDSVGNSGEARAQEAVESPEMSDRDEPQGFWDRVKRWWARQG